MFPRINFMEWNGSGRYHEQTGNEFIHHDGFTRLSFGFCGRFTVAEIVSFSLSVSIVCIWILTGHWLLMDAMGMGLCVAFIAFVRLPSLKVSTLLLMGLLIYDVFWVFFSSYIFNSNVMVRVATRPADNPVNVVAKRLHFSSNFVGGHEPPKLSLPGKLIFPSMNNNGHFSMLGLGDIVSHHLEPHDPLESTSSQPTFHSDLLSFNPLIPLFKPNFRLI